MKAAGAFLGRPRELRDNMTSDIGGLFYRFKCVGVLSRFNSFVWFYNKLCWNFPALTY